MTLIFLTRRFTLLLVLLITSSWVRGKDQLYTLPRALQDSLAAKVLADSLKAKADSVKTAATDSGMKDDTVTYSAASIRYRNDRFSLSKKALLTYKGSSLTADSIVFYSQDNVVEAMGSPLIQDPTNPPILGYRMRYNLKTKVGEIYYGSSKKDKQTFNGVEVRRQKNGDIYIARGDFSTCENAQDKHYYFYGRRMILQPKSKVLSGPIVMNIGDVPVAILPMMVMPLGSGRRSGLLQPKFGGDQALGFYLLGLGYYWAINDYTDFMASGDLLEGDKGTFDRTNFNSIFRYNKRYKYSGSVKLTSYLQEFDITQPAWSAEYTHDQNITPDLKQTLKGNGRFLSNPTLGERNATQEREKVQQSANASLGYRRLFDWNQGSLNLGLIQDYNLTDTLLDQSIPDFSYRVGGPLFPKPEDEGLGPDQLENDPWYRKITWSYNNHFNLNRVSKPKKATVRGDTNTYVGYSDQISLSGKYPLLKYFNLSPSVNFENLWSLQSRGDSSQPVQTSWDPKNEDFGEYFPHFNTNLNLDTRLYGIAQAQEKPWFGSWVGIRHTLIPSVGFTYAPKIDSNPRFLANPKIGGAAFQSKQQTITLRLGNEVDLKLAPEVLPISPNSGSLEKSNSSQPAKKPEPYKVISANSSASYNFSADSLQWSEITSTFSLYLTKNVAFSVNASHGLYDPYAPIGQRTQLTTPILNSYSFGWRKGIQVAGDFNSGVRIKDTRGFPTSRFDHTPWSADINYSFDFRASRVAADNANALQRVLGTSGTFQRTRTHQASGSLKLNPTQGWKMSYDTDYNFSDGRFSKHSFAFHRTLHCWEMDFHWTPIGISEGWNFNIRITELPDVKLESSDSKSRRPRSR